MMKARRLAIVLLAATLFAGCHKSVTLTDSDKVDQNNIFQLYKAKCDAESGKMEVTAVFRLDHRSGEQLRLTEPSKVTVNGQEMELNDQGEYTRSIGKYQQLLPFEYTNNNRQQFKNTIITNTIAFNQDNITLNKNKTNHVTVKAEPFEESESVSCMLTKGDETVEIDFDFENGRLTITPDMLEPVQTGEYTARLVRKNYGYQLKALDRGGEWESQYVSPSKKITIQ